MMKAHAMTTDEWSSTVWITYRESPRNGDPGVDRSAFLITTDPEHADRIVHAINSPKQASFPALCAASAARAEQERRDWL